MFRMIRRGALATALLGMGFSPALAVAASPSPAANPENEGLYKSNQIILVKETGKPDRRGLIVSSKKLPDGSLAYQIKALDNGEMLTIYDRSQRVDAKTAPAAQPVASKPVPKTDVKSTAILPKTQPAAADDNLPRSQVRGSDPLLNPTIIDPKAPVKKPETSQANRPAVVDSTRPGFFKSLFGKSEPQPTPASTCATCKTPQPATATACTTCKTPAVVAKTTPTKTQPTLVAAVPATTKQVQPVAASKLTMPAVETPVARGPTDPVPIFYAGQQARGPSDPVSIPLSYGPSLPAPQVRTNPMEPAMLPIYQAPIDPVRQAVAYQQSRTVELKDALKNAERPSHRITAAEELSAGVRGQTPEVRVALMLAAQDDPAGMVRAACIRSLSHQGVRDEAFMSVLVAAQNDKDASVRDEAAVALQKAMRK